MEPHQKITPGLAAKLCFTATRTGSYAQAAAVAARWGVTVDDSVLHRQVPRAGERADQQAQARVNASAAPTSTPKLAGAVPPGALVIMMDGWMVRPRGGDWGLPPAQVPGERVAWQECKSAVIYRLAQAAQTQGGRGLLAGTGLTGHTFNHFFPWQINEDGTEEETVNHVGRHEPGGSYGNAAFNNDPNIQDLYYFGNHYNTNVVENFLQVREDPNTPGLFHGIDAPEFGPPAGGQLVSLTGGPNVNASAMRITYLTPRSTHSYASSPATIPPDHSGFYRNPLKTADGYLIAAHTACALYESSGGSTAFPKSSYDFRLKFLQLTNGFYAPSAPLTTGLTNRAAYWSPDSLVTQPITPNLMAVAPTPTGPNQIWVSDITHVRTDTGWPYVAAVLDRWSRCLIGLAMAEHMETSLVEAALAQAVRGRRPVAGRLLHSDRGSQYASAAYRAGVAQAGLVASMSRAGHCYDNAAMESFWGKLKTELVHRHQFTSPAEARTTIFEHVEVFYNRRRLHRALGFLSPVDFENQTN